MTSEFDFCSFSIFCQFLWPQIRLAEPDCLLVCRVFEGGAACKPLQKTARVLFGIDRLAAGRDHRSGFTARRVLLESQPVGRGRPLPSRRARSPSGLPLSHHGLRDNAVRRAGAAIHGSACQ